MAEDLHQTSVASLRTPTDSAVETMADSAAVTEVMAVLAVVAAMSLVASKSIIFSIHDGR